MHAHISGACTLSVFGRLSFMYNCFASPRVCDAIAKEGPPRIAQCCLCTKTSLFFGRVWRGRKTGCSRADCLSHVLSLVGSLWPLVSLSSVSLSESSLSLTGPSHLSLFLRLSIYRRAFLCRFETVVCALCGGAETRNSLCILCSDLRTTHGATPQPLPHVRCIPHGCLLVGAAWERPRPAARRARARAAHGTCAG